MIGARVVNHLQPSATKESLETVMLTRDNHGIINEGVEADHVLPLQTPPLHDAADGRFQIDGVRTWEFLHV